MDENITEANHSALLDETERRFGFRRGESKLLTTGRSHIYECERAG